MNDLAVQAKNGVQSSTQITTLKGAKSNQVMAFFSAYRGQIAQALPKHLTPERMIAMATNLITQNPKLGECSMPSLVGAVMQASILGFQPVQALGECYFVPYGGHIQFQIGYKGFIRLAQRSGELTDIYAEIVREGDVFETELGLHRKLIHKPNLGSNGKVQYAYAVAHFKNGGYAFVVLTVEEIEKLRKRNSMQKNGASGAWQTDYEAMAKAKAIKQLAKYLPLSVDILNAVESDGGVISVESFQGGELPPENVDYVTGEIVDNDSDNDEVIDAK